MLKIGLWVKRCELWVKGFFCSPIATRYSPFAVFPTCRIADLTICRKFGNLAARIRRAFRIEEERLRRAVGKIEELPEEELPAEELPEELP